MAPVCRGLTGNRVGRDNPLAFSISAGQTRYAEVLLMKSYPDPQLRGAHVSTPGNFGLPDDGDSGRNAWWFRG